MGEAALQSGGRFEAEIRNIISNLGYTILQHNFNIDCIDPTHKNKATGRKRKKHGIDCLCRLSGRIGIYISAKRTDTCAKFSGRGSL